MKRTYTNRMPYLIALEVGEKWYFPHAKLPAVLGTIQRIRKQYPDRDYTAVTEEGGVLVFRIEMRKRKRGGHA